MDLRQSRFWLAALLVPNLLTATIVPAAAQTREVRQPAAISKTFINLNTVGIMAGKSDSSYLAAVEDMAAVLDDGVRLRVVAMLGKGALQNVQDVLSLQNTDMGVTQANVLRYLQKTRELGGDIENRLHYITKLFNEEVHVVAGSSVSDLRDLNGKTVNVGEVGSGTQLTAQLIFEALGIQVQTVNMVQSDALVAIQNGQIAATMLVAGKPSPIFDIFRLKGDLKLLPIPYEEALEVDYLPTQFTHEDYPTLVPKGETVETVAVPAVLAVFNWRPGTDRYRRVATFVEAFFSKFEEFRKSPRHPKWREVNLTADLPGWQRFVVAKTWLERNAAQSAVAQPGAAATPSIEEQQRRTFLEFLASQQGAGGGPPSAQQEALFRQFLDWMQKSKATAASGTPAASAARAAPGPDTPAAAPGAPAVAPAQGSPRLW
ncbi:MAG: TAXI family TRAP transporter solute-binding subunit [Hyphomicrobiaceae bacterium]|nr:TAXI family TRAP transporter solute-binding subunit [Hyphomicrobiaceae bacterium]